MFTLRRPDLTSDLGNFDKLADVKGTDTNGTATFPELQASDKRLEKMNETDKSLTLFAQRKTYVTLICCEKSQGKGARSIQSAKPGSTKCNNIGRLSWPKTLHTVPLLLLFC